MRSLMDYSQVSALLRFARIDDTTTRALRQAWPAIEQNLDEILDAFYTHIATEQKLADMVAGQHSRLKHAQRTHWEHLFSANFDATYVDAIRRIGRAHHKIGLGPHWYMGGYLFVLNELTRTVLHAPVVSRSDAEEQVVAVERAVLLDMSLALGIYRNVAEI